jgi:hypothetical protein
MTRLRRELPFANLSAAVGRFVAPCRLGKSDGTTVGGHLLEAHVRPTLGHADPAAGLPWKAQGRGERVGPDRPRLVVTMAESVVITGAPSDCRAHGRFDARGRRRS